MWIVYTILGIFLLGLLTLCWLLWPVLKVVLAIIFSIILALVIIIGGIALIGFLLFKLFSGVKL